MLRRTTPECYPLVVLYLRIEGHGRLRELMHGREVLVTVAVVLALSPLPIHGQEVESVGGGHRRGRSLPVCGRVEIGPRPLSASTLSFSGRPVSILGLIPVSPGPLSA